MTDLLTQNLAAFEARDRRAPAIAAAGNPVGAPEVPCSIEAAEEWLRSQLGDSHPRTIIFIGMGSGLVLDALERRGSAVEVLVLEPDPAAAVRLLSRRDWRDWIGTRRLTLFVGPDFAGASGAWRPAEVPRADPPTLVHPSTGERNADAVSRARDLANRMISEARANAETRRLHAGRYLLQTIANAPRIAREGDASALGGLFRNVPAIVVAAGPSLDKELQTIAAFRDRALIICCDTAARTLLSAGIAPHFIVSHDPSEENVMHLGALPMPRTSWLVAEGSLHPAAFPLFDGRTFMFNVSDHHPWPWLASLGIKRGRLAAWGSVATTALDLAIGMGCSPVVFAGLDLAFTEGRPVLPGHDIRSPVGHVDGLRRVIQRSLRSAGSALARDHGARCPRTTNADREPYARLSKLDTRSRGFGARRAVLQRDGCRHPASSAHRPEAHRAGKLQTAGPLIASTVEATLRTAHRPAHDGGSRLLQAVDTLLSRRPTVSPFPEWMQFAMGTVGVDLLQAALRSHEYHAWCLGQTSVRATTYH